MNQALLNKVDGERPLYDQVYQTLLQQIGNGTYPVQQKLPSEKELSELFNVSRITIRQALNQLQLEHLVYKIQGKGTFVSAPKTFQNISQLQGFAEAMRNMGHEVFNVVKAFRLFQPHRKLHRSSSFRSTVRWLRFSGFVWWIKSQFHLN